MVAVLTAWILLKAFFFMVVIFGPIALIVLAVESRLKKTAQGTYIAAVIKASLGTVVVIALTGAFLWAVFHYHFHLGDWLRALVIPAFALALIQDWKRVRQIARERRQAKSLAESQDNLPNGFTYESDARG